MFRKSALALTLLILLPVFLFAQEGKLRGKITDKESGEPLIGANVQIEGMTLGASSDVDGNYVILSVPVGTYTLKVTYVGYSPIEESNVRVNSNLSTILDFKLSSTAVQVKPVEIVAERQQECDVVHSDRRPGLHRQSPPARNQRVDFLAAGRGADWE